MASVVTAVVAAFLAGAIALFRERRRELRSLLVAARVVRQLMLSTSVNFQDAANSEYAAREALMNVPGRKVFNTVWEAHRDTLAGNLTDLQWPNLQIAVNSYFLAIGLLEGAPDRLTSSELFAAAGHLSTAALTLEPFCRKTGFLRNPGRSSVPGVVEFENSRT